MRRLAVKLLQQLQVAALVIKRGVGKPQRHDVVQGIDIGPPLHPQRQRIGPVGKIRLVRQPDG